MTLKAYAKLDFAYFGGSGMRQILILTAWLAAASAFWARPAPQTLRPLTPFSHLVPKPLVNAPYPDPDDPRAPKKVTITERYSLQKLDHTNPDDDRTWYQRYLEADEFHTDGGPVFLLIGGPWKANGELAVNGSVALLGRDLGAIYLELEHRYYGKSKPTESMTNEELEYLTIEQAILDIANFTRTLQADPKYSGPWIIYGSGYAANLASWTRAQFPELFVGAYASCPRLWVRPNFESYYQTVHAAYEDAMPSCGQNITAGFREMEMIVAAGDSAKLTDAFTFCDDQIDTRDPVDVQNLYNIMTTTIASFVETARVGNLTDNVCYWIGSSWGGTAFERVAFVVSNQHWGSCFISDYQEALEYTKNATYWSEDFYEKQWMYQLCSELGQFQTTSTTLGPNFVPIDHFLIYCSTVFGLNLGHLEQSADRLNELYGGLSPKGTNVIYTIGELDPWHGLGNHQGTPDSPVIVIQDASHGLDLSGPGQNDTIYIQAARAQVAEIILSWLN